MVLVVVLGVMLLLGERYSRTGFSGNRTSVPSAPVGVGEEAMLYGNGEAQKQMESASFVIRPGQSKLTYTQALDLYKNSTLQFGEDCRLATASRSFSLNTEVMIDNRSSKPNTFSIGGTAIVVGPYDFGFLILKEKGTTISVGCGGQNNVGQLSVQ